MKLSVSLLAMLLATAGANAAAPIVLYHSAWEAAPASPAWAQGLVVPQNGWLNFNNAAAHAVVLNGTADATIGGQAVVTPTGTQFHKFTANPSTTGSSMREAYPDLTAALGALPATHKIIRASLDVFVPQTQSATPALHGIIGGHGEPGINAVLPWGVMVDASDRSVNLWLDDLGVADSDYITGVFPYDTWFNVAIIVNYTTKEVNVEYNGAIIAALTRTSSTLTDPLTHVTLTSWNYYPPGPTLRSICSDNFLITAEDGARPRPPVIICPSNLVAGCAGPGGTPVSFNATAVDTSGAAVPVVCVPASGTLFGFGVTAVGCVAVDMLGGSNSCGFQVIVQDHLAPVIHCPGNFAVAIDVGLCGAIVDYAVHSLSASDECSGVTVICVPPTGSLLPVGTNGVTCTAQDASGNQAQCSFAVTVVVRPEAPVFTVTYPERDARTLSNQVQVCMATAFSNGTIYFTDDGSAPDTGATRYTNCVQLFYEGVFPDRQVLTLKAIALSSNGLVTAAACPLEIVLTPFCDGNFRLLTKAESDGGGEVRRNPVREKYPCDLVVHAEAHPAAGWTFMGWLGDATGTEPVTPVLMTRDKCVEGVFGTTLRTNVIGGGSVRVLPGAAIYPYGSQVSIFAVPASGHYFLHWTNLLGVDITPAGRTSNPFRQRITDALPTLTAVFLPLPAGQYTLTVLVDGLGTVSLSPYSNRYPSSVVVTNRATPAAGQTFLGWTGDASGTSTPLLLTMDQSRVITANFTRAPRLDLYRCEGELAGDVFQLVMKGELGGSFVLERAAQLDRPIEWQTLGVFTNSLPWAQFDDSYPPAARQWFYRLRLVP